MMQDVEHSEIEKMLTLNIECDMLKIEKDLNIILSEKTRKGQPPIIYGSTIINGLNIDFEIRIAVLISALLYEVSNIRNGKIIYKGSRSITVKDIISIISNAALLF